MNADRVVVALSVAPVGLAVGSFLTVVVHRLPIGRSLVAPRSSCPSCGVTIRARDNVPVLSFLLRRGHCRDCGASISPRYLVIELLTAASFVAVALRSPSLWLVPAYCVLCGALLALSAIDLSLQRLPARLCYVALALGAPLLVLAAGETRKWEALGAAALSGLVALGGFLLVHLAIPRGMGFGDVRLAGVCGLFLGFLGYRVAIVGFELTFLLGGATAIVLLAARRIGRAGRLPFGPFLAAGSLGAVLFGGTLAPLLFR